MGIIDYILIGVVIGSSLAGYNRGFFNGMVSFVGVMLGTVLGYLLSRPLASIIYATSGIREIIENYVNENIRMAFAEISTRSTAGLEEGLGNLGASGEVLGRMVAKLDVEQIEIVMRQGKSVSGLIQTQVSDMMESLVISAMAVVAFIVVYIVVVCLVRRLFGLIDVRGKIPLVGGVDRLLGMVQGLVKGLTIVVVICYITSLTVGVQGEGWQRVIDESMVYSKVIG